MIALIALEPPEISAHACTGIAAIGGGNYGCRQECIPGSARSVLMTDPAGFVTRRLMN